MLCPQRCMLVGHVDMSIAGHICSASARTLCDGVEWNGVVRGHITQCLLHRSKAWLLFLGRIHNSSRSIRQLLEHTSWIRSLMLEMPRTLTGVRGSLVTEHTSSGGHRPHHYYQIFVVFYSWSVYVILRLLPLLLFAISDCCFAICLYYVYEM